MTAEEGLEIVDGEVKYIRGAYIDERMDIPQGVTAIGRDAFRLHLDLRVVVVPDGVTHIGACAFERCQDLEMIYLPKSVVRIDDDAFSLCRKLTIYCEDKPTEDWIDRIEERTFRTTTPEDDAFNFHRSGGGFTSTTYKQRVHVRYNPEKREVVTNVSREQFEQLAQQLLKGLN